MYVLEKLKAQYIVSTLLSLKENINEKPELSRRSQEHSGIR